MSKIESSNIPGSVETHRLSGLHALKRSKDD